MRAPLLLTLLLLAAPAPAADDDPESLAKEARRLLDRGRYADSLARWERILDEHGRSGPVESGDAHWYASRCLRHLGEPAAAAELLEGYLKRFPEGEGTFAALVGCFHAFREAGEEKRAQKVGRTIFSDWPDAKGTFWILRSWLEHGWGVPRLKTRYDVLYRWAFDRIGGAREPDLRLAFLDAIESNHRGEKFVKGGAIEYCRAWAHVKAGRPERGLEIGEKYLKRYPRDANRDKMRVLMARALLDFTPPETERARKLLRSVLANPGTRYREEAEKLLGVEPEETGIQITEGCPKAEGLGKIVLLTNLPAGSAYRKATSDWRKARDARVLSFRGDVGTARGALASAGPEFVAILVAPSTLDGNFHLDVLELCRGLDADPMPDFHFGYLSAREPAGLERQLARILEREAEEGREGRVVGVPTSGAAVAGLDHFLHFGHGTPRRIVKGLDAEGVSALTLDRGPVVFSGACFNGVCSRSYASSVMDRVFHPPEDLRPDEVISLAWIRAGATALFAAMDGDRGEMAVSEWEYKRGFEMI